MVERRDEEETQNKSQSGTPDAVWFCLRPASNHRRGVANNVFESLAGGPRALDEVSRETGASTRGLRAIMNALVGLELLTKRGQKYSLTSESEAFLVKNRPGTLAGF
jgi:Dimerisation domain